MIFETGTDLTRNELKTQALKAEKSRKQKTNYKSRKTNSMEVKVVWLSVLTMLAIAIMVTMFIMDPGLDQSAAQIAASSSHAATKMDSKKIYKRKTPTPLDAQLDNGLRGSL